MAGAFALGAVPSSFGASPLAQHIAEPRLRHAFLIGSGIAFVLYRILGT